MSPEVAGTTEADEAERTARACPPADDQCQVWALPPDPSCAAAARALLAEALAGLGLPRATIADAQLVVSELATNAYQHAGRDLPHELWLCPPGGGRHPWSRGPNADRLICGVFDGRVGSLLPDYSWTSGDYGRGLTIVAELTEGRWGMRHVHSRLRPWHPGKAVWFAIPVQ